MFKNRTYSFPTVKMHKRLLIEAEIVKDTGIKALKGNMS